MRLEEFAQVLDLEELTPAVDIRANGDATEGDASESGLDITQGYASDLLSDVLANAPAGGVLVTLQVHLNVIAVASHAGLKAVIFSCGRRPEDDVVERASGEGLRLFVSPADTFEIVGRLYELGLRGTTA
ncbi:MAG: serine kinase [Actinobacteria bacterium]|nr:serine kinase [Actinomycetota bacterium]